MMLHRLFMWTLALMTNAVMPVADGEPEDPYQWLEDVSGARSLAWVKERNAESTKELTGSAEFQALDRRILRILDSEDRIPNVQKLGPYYYNFWRDGKNPRGLWRRTTLEEFKKAKPAWEIVLDLDLLGKEEKENWVWHGAQALKPDYKLALISLSRGGADASVIREFDLDGEDFPRGRIHAARSEEPGRVARPRQRVRGNGFRPGLADRVGLPSHCQGMEAGYAARGSRRGHGGAAQRYEREPRCGTLLRGTSAISSYGGRHSGRPKFFCGAMGSSSRSRNPQTPWPR